MCGIVGYMTREKVDIFENKKILTSMMDKIIHRGPDGSGTYIDYKIALGHRRLSIIDIEGGTQPMKNEDGKLVCIFNGETYNFKELRKELEKEGHVFATESDTEVLLHGYEQWGKALPGRLRGMFAFAIWDRAEEELFCARDYFGIKPFYYYQREDVFLFGSEIKSFLPHPGFQKELNREQLELYLTYQYSPGEKTFFENVYKLPPAHSLVWKNGKVRIEPYWKPIFESGSDESNKVQFNNVKRDLVKSEECKEMEEWAKKISTVMKESVTAHKISDVEVGSFLSSGVDSSYIASLSDVSQTFTIGFEEAKYDEASYAHAFGQTLGSRNHVYRISAEEFWDKLPEIQYYMDEPLADAAAAALYFLNREASKHVKVCLSGEGADELFGGYKIYKEPFMCQRYDRLPSGLRLAMGKIAEIFPSMPGVNFLIRHSKPLGERYIGNTSLFSEKEKKKMMKDYTGKVRPMDLVKQGFGIHPRNLAEKDSKHGTLMEIDEDSATYEEIDDVTRMQLTDINLWLPGDILLKADKMSMANSLELRVPFLDKEVFQIASRLPTEYRVNAKETKIALRHAAADVVGEEISQREKLGFPVPVRDWLRREPYASQVREIFKSSVAAEFFHTEYLLKMLHEHVSGRRDRWREIWCVYMFLVWYEVYFDEKN